MADSKRRTKRAAVDTDDEFPIRLYWPRSRQAELRGMAGSKNLSMSAYAKKALEDAIERDKVKR